MYSNPSACEYRYDATPYDVRNSSASAKIIARGRCALLDGGDGKCKDFVQEIESGEKNQHDSAENSTLGPWSYI
jgi:hypothetical protein